MVHLNAFTDRSLAESDILPYEKFSMFLNLGRKTTGTSLKEALEK